MRPRRALRPQTSKRPKPTRFTVALADGSLDPGVYAANDGLDRCLRLPGVGRDAFDQVAEKHDALPLLSLRRAGSMALRPKQQAVDEVDLLATRNGHAGEPV